MLLELSMVNRLFSLPSAFQLYRPRCICFPPFGCIWPFPTMSNQFLRHSLLTSRLFFPHLVSLFERSKPQLFLLTSFSVTKKSEYCNFTGILLENGERYEDQSWMREQSMSCISFGFSTAVSLRTMSPAFRASNPNATQHGVSFVVLLTAVR